MRLPPLGLAVSLGRGKTLMDPVLVNPVLLAVLILLQAELFPSLIASCNTSKLRRSCSVGVRRIATGCPHGIFVPVRTVPITQTFRRGPESVMPGRTTNSLSLSSSSSTSPGSPHTHVRGFRSCSPYSSITSTHVCAPKGTAVFRAQTKRAWMLPAGLAALGPTGWPPRDRGLDELVGG